MHSIVLTCAQDKAGVWLCAVSVSLQSLCDSHTCLGSDPASFSCIHARYRAHGCTQMMLDRLQGRCNYHTDSANWLSLHTTTLLPCLARRSIRSNAPKAHRLLPRRINEKKSDTRMPLRALCSDVHMTFATEGATCTFSVSMRAQNRMSLCF